jgi:protein tyrosine/serine phosphatase
MKRFLKKAIYISIRIILGLAVLAIIYGLKTNKIQDAFQKNFFPKQYRAERMNQLETELKYFKSYLTIGTFEIKKRMQKVKELRSALGDNQELVEASIQSVQNEIQSKTEMQRLITEIIKAGGEELNRIKTEDWEAKRGDTLGLTKGEIVAPESKPKDEAKGDSKSTGETIAKMGQEATMVVKGVVKGLDVRLEFDARHLRPWDVADSFSDKLKSTGVVPGIFFLSSTVHYLYNFNRGNFYAITADEAYRSAQLNKDQLEYYIKKYKIKSILNLNSKRPDKDWYKDEIRFCLDNDVAYYNVGMLPDQPPNKILLEKLMLVLKDAPRPILIHCRKGSDRTGLVSAIWKMVIDKEPKSEAARQLSLKYLYFPIGNGAILGRFLKEFNVEDYEKN